MDMLWVSALQDIENNGKTNEYGISGSIFDETMACNDVLVPLFRQIKLLIDHLEELHSDALQLLRFVLLVFR